MKAFLMLLPQLLEDFFQKALIGFGEYEMGLKKKSFACKCCGNDREFNWKTRHGKETAILTKGYCTLKGFKHTISYLENARGDMFTAIENRLNGRTTSRVERLFRTC